MSAPPPRRDRTWTGAPGQKIARRCNLGYNDSTARPPPAGWRDVDRRITSDEGRGPIICADERASQTSLAPSACLGVDRSRRGGGGGLRLVLRGEPASLVRRHAFRRVSRC